jgi:cell division septum initiation protein DivIVA
MTDRMLNDAHNLKKLIREAEALADESMIAFARLKQAMLTARQNPGVEVHTGQRALMRLNQAEEQAMAMSTSLLRVHDELSKVAREKMAGDTGVPTVFPESALSQNDVEIA